VHSSDSCSFSFCVFFWCHLALHDAHHGIKNDNEIVCPNILLPIKAQFTPTPFEFASDSSALSHLMLCNPFLGSCNLVESAEGGTRPEP
jgi:hypothetical protein